MNIKDKNGNEAIHCSILNNNINVTNILLQFGANINSPNKKGKTAKEILMKIREILPSITKHDINSRLYTFKNKKLVAKDRSSVPLWICS